MRILTIETSIKKDIASEVGRFLLENDFEYEEAGDNKKSIYENSILALCNALDKIVLPKHYKVHYSKELLYKMNNQFDEQLNNLIKLFETKFREGHKVVLSLSRKVFDSQFYDVLFNVWSIKHLHLCDKSISSKSQMRKNRSSNLLFFVIDNDNVYFLDVKKHPKTDEFVSLSFLEILKANNWLSVIGVMECDNITDIKPIINNDKELYQLYSSNLNVSLFNLGGKSYHLLNGISCSGNKINHTYTLIHLNRQIDKIAQNYAEYIGFELTLNDNFGVLTVKKENNTKRFTISY